MYSGILQKLNHKKAVIRLNMLRIVRSICEPNEDGGQDIKAHPIFEAIDGLAENDGAVLVRNMASELVRSTFEIYDAREQEMSTGGGRNRSNVRRQGSYPNQIPGLSTPSTPTHGGRANHSYGPLLDAGSTPRRSGLSAERGDGLLCRPRSRDGPFVGRKVSTESVNGTPLNKSRLPRTAPLRPARPSLAPPTMRDSIAESLFGSGKRGGGDSSGNASAGSGGARVRSEPKQPSASLSHLVSKRRPRAPSGNIEWS